jgi:hypothetical protein
MKSNLLRYRTFNESPILETINVSSNKQESSINSKQMHETVTDDAAYMMRKMGINSKKITPSGSKMAFKYQ